MPGNERQQETARERPHHTERIEDTKAGRIKSGLAGTIRMYPFKQDAIGTQDDRHQKDIQRERNAGKQQVTSETTKWVKTKRPAPAKQEDHGQQHGQADAQGLHRYKSSNVDLTQRVGP